MRRVIITTNKELVKEHEANNKIVVILVDRIDLYNSKALMKYISVGQRMRADKIEIDYSNIEK